MKAAVQRRFGSPDAVAVDEVPTPEPASDEVLVRVHASTVGVVDSLARRGSPTYARVHFGLRKPRFAVGDPVFGTIAPRFGAHAEYVCLSEHGAIAAKPGSLSYAEASALVDATALCFLRDKARLRPGQTIAINGASGSVGTAAVQLAKHFDATVTGVCSSRGADLVRKLGADEVVDYTETDFARTGRAYEVIFDVAGTSSFAHCRAALSDVGIYLTTAPSPAIFASMTWTARFGRKKAAIAFTGLRDAAANRSFDQTARRPRSTHSQATRAADALPLAGRRRSRRHSHPRPGTEGHGKRETSPSR